MIFFVDDAGEKRDDAENVFKVDFKSNSFIRSSLGCIAGIFIVKVNF